MNTDDKVLTDSSPTFHRAGGPSTTLTFPKRGQDQHVATSEGRMAAAPGNASAMTLNYPKRGQRQFVS